MIENPLFSIVVPVYKVEKYLHQCLDSLINQDFTDFEVILVDDGSPDSCPRICDDYAAMDYRIKVIHKTNGGLSDARNAGIAEARGKYVTFVDSDDFWYSKDVLSEVQKIVLNNNCPDIVVSDIIKYYEHSDKYLYPSIICSDNLNGKTKQEALDYLYYRQGDLKMSACQKFVRRDILQDVSFEKGLLSEDIDWSLQVYPKAKTIAVCTKPYYCYRQQREGSITNTASARSFESLMHIIYKWKKLLPSLSIPEEEQKIYMGYLAYQLSICMLLYGKLSLKDRKAAYRKIKGHMDLFTYPLNRKTDAVRRLINVIGVRNTCTALKFFVKVRSLLKLG